MKSHSHLVRVKVRVGDRVRVRVREYESRSIPGSRSGLACRLGLGSGFA